MAKCLILGANGFLGSHLVDELILKGHQIKAFDRFSNEKYKFLQSKHIEIVSGDFLNKHDIIEALGGVDYVFHFISTTNPLTAENDPLIDVDTNIRMSIQLFEECAKKGVLKVVFASTGGAIYGDSREGIFDETSLPLPLSPYAIGKLTIEHYLSYYAKKYSLKSTVYRISNPYGERQSLTAKQGVIPIFLQRIFNNEPITVLGDGSMIRDYVYVKDVANLIATSFEHANQSLYNLGSGKGATINEVIDIIRGVVDKEFTIKHREAPSTFVKKSVLDMRRFKKEFGVEPVTSLEYGIEQTWQYISNAR